MKNKFTTPMKLIIAFYVLVVTIGIAQIVWALRYGAEYRSPTIEGFYMIHRTLLSACAILLFILRKSIALYWVLAWESATNIFFMLHYIYMLIWLTFQCQNIAEIRQIIAYVGLELGWNSILMLISITIVGYVISTFKNTLAQSEK